MFNEEGRRLFMAGNAAELKDALETMHLPVPSEDIMSGAASASATERKISGSDVVFVLGGPGSGKGTQCALLTDKFGFTHLSAGDLLREEVASGSEQGLVIESIIKEGKIVPGQTTIDLLKAAMARKEGPYLVDGFPRSMDNARTFEEQVGKARCALFIDVSEADLQARLLERGKTSGRDDDNIETILKRFQTFQVQSMPVVEHLEASIPVHKISGEKPKEAVFEEVCGVLGLGG